MRETEPNVQLLRIYLHLLPFIPIYIFNMEQMEQILIRIDRCISTHKLWDLLEEAFSKVEKDESNHGESKKSRHHIFSKQVH